MAGKRWASPPGIWALALAAVFLLAAFLRFRLPQTPFIDRDFWGYLYPAISQLTSGDFRPTNGRDPLYPGFVCLTLRAFGDFRAIAVAQHGIGLATGGLLLLALRRFYRLLGPGPRPLPPFVKALGLALAMGYLNSHTVIEFEHRVRPEAIFPFFAILSLWLNLEFIRRRWVEPRPGLAVGLGVATMVGSVLLYKLKPSMGLAVGFINLPWLVSMFAPGASARRKVAMAAGGVILAGAGLVLPERLLFDRGAGSPSLFLPDTLYTIHAHLIRDQLTADLAGDSPLPFPREVLTKLRDRTSALLAVSSQPKAHPFPSLGFNPDYLLYTDNVYKTILPRDPAGDRMRRSIGFTYYFRAAARQPGRMLAKIGRQLEEFYQLERLLPWRTLRSGNLRLGRRKNPLDRFYARNLALYHSHRADLEPYAPAREFEAASRRLAQGKGSFNRNPATEIAQAVLNLLYTPILLATLFLGARTLVAARRRAGIWLAPWLTLFVFTYNLGNNLTIAVVHTMDNDRYPLNELSFTLLASACGLLFLRETFLRRRGEGGAVSRVPGSAPTQGHPERSAAESKDLTSVWPMAPPRSV